MGSILTGEITNEVKNNPIPIALQAAIPLSIAMCWEEKERASKF